MEEKVCTPSSVQLGDISPRNAAGSLIPPPANTALDLRGENCAQSFQMFGAFYNTPLELQLYSSKNQQKNIFKFAFFNSMVNDLNCKEDDVGDDLVGEG